MTDKKTRPARFVIERDRMFVENACRATNGERVTPSNIEPDPKNPIVAAFFREIAYADQLGSGVKNLYKYAKAYGGDDPVFQDGDMFTISVSLEKIKDLMPFLPNDPEVAQTPPAATPAVPPVVPPALTPAVAEVAQKGAEVAQKREQVAQKDAEVAQKREQAAQKLAGKGRIDAIENALSVFDVIARQGDVSIGEMEKKTTLSNGSVKNAIRLLRVNGIVEREGSDRGGKWIVTI